MARPGQKPKRTAPIEWTPEWAYFVGLVASDGCLSGDGRHISIVSKDKELLEQLKEKLGFVAKISPHLGSKFGTFAWHIQIGDVVLYRWLMEIGLTPRKSKTIGILKVPSGYFSHFLRGLFDGDGCIYSYWDKRYPDSYMYYVTFSSASGAFLDWLQKTIYTLYILRGHQTPCGKGAWALKFSKHRARELLYRIYDQPTIALKRKFKKTIAIWGNDPQVFADSFGIV